MEKDSLTTTPSTDSKSPVNIDSSRQKKKGHTKSTSNVDKDDENNEKTLEKENSVKSKDISDSPLATKLPEEDDVVYLKIDKALLSRPDIAKLLLESENQGEQANNSVNSVNVGQQNTFTSSVVPPQQPTGLAGAPPQPPIHSQLASIAPVMPVQYQQGYYMQPAQAVQSVPYVAEEQEVVTFTTGQRLVNVFCVKCFIFQILHADNNSVLCEESNTGLLSIVYTISLFWVSD